MIEQRGDKMPTQKDFSIQKCKDCLRITRIDIDGDKHCHLHSRKLAETIINNVCSNKIPLRSHSRTLECMVRLSNDDLYIKRINELLDHRKQKGCKLKYINSDVKKSF